MFFTKNNVQLSKLFSFSKIEIINTRMRHLAKKLNTTYNTNPVNIFNKIAFSFPNLMTLDISDKFVFVIDESRGFFPIL